MSDKDQKPKSDKMPLPAPPNGNEWFFQVLKRVEEMHDATVGPGSPVKILQKQFETLCSDLRSDRDQTKKYLTDLHNDYIGLHNLILAEQRRNDENWKRVNANYELLRDELNKVKIDIKELERREALVKGEVNDLKLRVDDLERRVG